MPEGSSVDLLPLLLLKMSIKQIAHNPLKKSASFGQINPSPKPVLKDEPSSNNGTIGSPPSGTRISRHGPRHPSTEREHVMRKPDNRFRSLVRRRPEQHGSAKPSWWRVRTERLFCTTSKAWIQKDAPYDTHTNTKVLQPKTPLQKRLLREKLEEIPTTKGFSCNHGMINKERVIRGVTKLKRSTALDDRARQHAEAMARRRKLFVSSDDSMRNIQRTSEQEVGQNVMVGYSVSEMQSHGMKQKDNKHNILDKRFHSMGIGTASDSHGKLYLCQVFSS